MQASSGSAGSTGFLAGLGFAGGVFAGGSTVPSVAPQAGDKLTVYRVFGGDSRAQGMSWTEANPTTVTDFRNVAGLPSGGESGVVNTANFMVRGNTTWGNVIRSRPAQALDGNAGGLPEMLIVPDKVTLTDFWVLKP